MDPQIRVRLVQGDNFDKCSVWIAALNVQWPARFSVIKDKTTRAIFVGRIIFDHFTSIGYSIFDLRYTYVSDDALINRMFGKLILACLKF